MSAPLRLLILGAHPDDAEYHAGGIAAAYRAAGHVVRMVSVTNGAAGHQTRSPEMLAAERAEEAAAAAAVIDAEAAVWEYPDGRLLPTIELRERIVRELRRFEPDLVLTHRPCDYHPDHRAVGQAVQDAAYLVTVPLVAPDSPVLPKPPVIAAMCDPFTRPAPFTPDVAWDVEPWLPTVVAMLARHASQFFEWLPFNEGTPPEAVPADEADRLAWLQEWFLRRTAWRADRFRDRLAASYGSERADAMRAVEAYEASEYAAPLDDATRRRLFFMAPA